MTSKPDMTDTNKERAAFYAWLRTYEAEVGAVDEASAWVGFLGGRASLAASAGREPAAYRHLHEDGWEYYDAPTGADCPGCEALYTHPSPPEGMVGGWQDIATAPKDGTLIVLGARNGVWLGKYRPVYTSGYRPDNPWASMLLNHDHMAERYTRPTHWMPLPAPPLAAGGGREAG